MTQHRTSLLATLVLLQLPLLGCPQGGFFDDSGATTSSTTTPIDDTTFGHIQTVTGDVPTTGVPTTGENDTDPGQTPLEESCTSCGDPESVQVCFCIDRSAAEPKVLQAFYACIDDATLEPTAAQACSTLLNKPTLTVEDLHCMEQIMCSIEGTGNPLEDACQKCDDSTIDHFYCVSDEDALVAEHYACEDNPGAESGFKEQCAGLLDKLEGELTAMNFFQTQATCPGDDTTAGETTGSDATSGTTADNTTAGDTTADGTTAATTTGSDDTTGADTAGSSTTDGGTSGDGTTGGVAPLTGCGLWEPSAAITRSGPIHLVDVGLVTGLLADAAPLVECDDARLLSLQAGGYEVHNADPGELLHELGLRDRDIPQTLNGHSLADAGEVVVALGQLWFVEHESEYDLVVLREGRAVTLLYRLVY